MKSKRAAHKRRWDEVQRARIAARKITIDRVEMGVINGKPLVIDVIRVRKSQSMGVNFRLAAGDAGEGMSPYQEIALPRVAWLERPEI